MTAADDGYELVSRELSVSSVDQFVVHDLNGDGRLDIIASKGPSSWQPFQVWLQNAPATRSRSYSRTRLVEPFADDPSFKLDPSHDPEWLAVGDVNSDGAADLVYSTEASDESAIAVLYQNTSATTTEQLFDEDAVWESARTAGVYGHCALGDLNGDSRTDVAVAVTDKARIDIYEQLANGSLPRSPSRTISTGQEPRDIAIADLDGDAQIDLVVAEALERDIRVYLALDSTSTETVTADYIIDIPEKLDEIRLALGDLDGDARTDIVAGPYLAYQTATGFPNAVTTLSGGPLPVVADLDDDGRTDLLLPERVGYGGDLGYYYQREDGSLTTTPDYTYSATIYDCWAGDLYAEGNTDSGTQLVYATGTDITIEWPSAGVVLEEVESVYSYTDAGENASVRVTIRNVRDLEVNGLELAFSVDGTRIGTADIDCPSSGFSTSQTYGIPVGTKSGTRTVTVELIGPRGAISPTTADGTGSTTVEVQSYSDPFADDDEPWPIWSYFWVGFVALFVIGPAIARSVKKRRKEAEKKRKTDAAIDARLETGPGDGVGEYGTAAPAPISDPDIEYALATIEAVQERLHGLEREMELPATRRAELTNLIESARNAVRSRDGGTARASAKRALEVLEDAVAQTVPTFDVDLKAGTARAAEWVRMALVFTNNGPATVIDLRTDPSGGVEVEALDHIERLERGEEYVDEIGVKADQPGTVPLIFEFTFERPGDGATFTSKHEFWLEVTHGLEGVTTINIDRSVQISDSVIQRSSIGNTGGTGGTSGGTYGDEW